jgi:UDP-N-acetylglucosamine 1-carboxyvinyltransferase
VVYGRSGLGGATHRIIPDRIEAGTFLLAAVAAGGSIRVENVNSNELVEVLAVLDQMGAQLTVSPDQVAIQAAGRGRAIRVTTAPYPGFPTDLQAPLMAVLALADGRSRISEAVFPQRLMHVAELCRLGAKISLSGSTAAIEKASYLSGASVVATDLRAAAALTIAGLVARGRTCVMGMEHLDRGYVRFEQKLAQLGARVFRDQHVPPNSANVDIHAA